MATREPVDLDRLTADVAVPVDRGADRDVATVLAWVDHLDTAIRVVQRGTVDPPDHDLPDDGLRGPGDVWDGLACIAAGLCVEDGGWDRNTPLPGPAQLRPVLVA